MSDVITYTDFNADLEKTNRSDLSLFNNINSIKESVRNIILTKKGSSPMNPNFGSGVHGFIFNMLDSISTDNLKDTIMMDLANFESRIKVKNIDVRQETENNLFVTITYTINSLNVDDTVYITVEEST